MTKLNNKGLSIIELLVCFVIVAVISITLLNIVMDYNATQETENIKNIIKTYKNTVTKNIQNDIIKYGLSKVEVDQTNTDSDSVKLILTFKDLPDSISSKTKNLIIHASSSDNYVLYEDTVKSGNTYINQPVKYVLPHTTKIYVDKANDSINNTSGKENKNDIHFKNLPEPITGTESYVSNDVFYLYIPIEHSEVDETYGITIIAPLVH